MKKKKSVVALLSTVALVAVVAGCGEKDSSKTTASSTPAASTAVKREMKVSASIYDRGTVASEEGNYEENRWTKFINANSGVTVKWVPVPRASATDKLNVLFASGDAPDLVNEYDRGYIGKLVDQGTIQPIDSYIEKYSTSYKKYLNEHPELKPYLTFNGKMYAFSTVRPTVANQAMWIRQDWLDKLNLKTPTTMDELLEVARAFKDKDPDGNGKADTVPITFNGNYQSILRSMFSAVGQWYLEDGKMTIGQNTDRFGDELDLQKKLWEEGLVDKEYLTDKNFTRERQFFVTGKSGIYLAGYDIANEFRELKANDPNANPVPMEPVSTKYGKFGLYQETAPNFYSVLNKNAKDPEAAIKFIDWLVDKGWFTLKFGLEGTHYKLVNGIPQVIDADKNKKELSYAAEYPFLQQWTEKPENYPVMMAQDPISQEYAKKKGQSLQIALKNKFRRDVPYAPSFQELTDITAAIAKPVWDDVEAKVVTGGPQFNGKWAVETIRKEWKRLGGDKVDQLSQEWYEKNIKGK
ncbi:extracellular solute-binding protein [Paenibacillus roseipurpureus]|uniref:Extracellular solute-binding protein n=1 Tax=Paenibacillus roseopurpureus TaxID=2918901 RepID=A0AA96LST4_9BACL|nr:extracellular solute-binding protein [Paenibacillus sp. MBLB1832]WNR45268.1 extracellular solute-binding protein [Paenibacillus sp. MBLB1832]